MIEKLLGFSCSIFYNLHMVHFNPREIFEETTHSASKRINGFFDFIRTQGVIGLAVGFILGDKVKTLVTSLVDDIINPFLGYFLGFGENLKDAKLVIGEIVVSWGRFSVVLIDFVLVASIVYFLLKGIGLEKLDSRKP
jgi:large conductance mechanosensitive channel